MRWDELFADLEAQYAAAETAEFAAELSDRARAELHALRLADRLRPAVGRNVTARVVGGGPVEGTLTAMGPDWLLLAETVGREVLAPTHAIMSIAGLAAQSATPNAEGRVAARLTFGFALRGLVRDRRPVALTYIDASTTTGTLDRVGSDFIDIAEHAPGEFRRPHAVQAVRTVPFAAVALIRRT